MADLPVQPKKPGPVMIWLLLGLAALVLLFLLTRGKHRQSDLTSRLNLEQWQHTTINACSS